VTALRVDPWLPGVDIDVWCCPGCGQTLRDVLDGGRGLPDRHYRFPTARGRIRTVAGHGRPHDLCSYSGSDLIRLVFIEQRFPTTTNQQQGEPA
jgi:hypothetical protein